jgi:hypothetical protein
VAHADDDDDDSVHRQETVLEKSDRLAREYQREVRAREKRVRRIEGESESQRSRSTRSSSTNKSARSRDARARSKDRSKERGQDRSKERSQDRSKERSKDRSKSRPPQRAKERVEDSSERLSDPFPPIDKPKPGRSSKNRPARSRDARAQAPTKKRDELPRSRPVTPDITAPAHGPMDLLAMELEEQVREARFGWRSLRASDRVTLICVVFVIAGVLMPWRSDPAHPMQIGLLSGGVLHLAIALASGVLVLRSARSAGVRAVRDDLLRQRRYSLWLVLLGALSTFLGAFLLLLFGLEKAPDWPVRIHFGIYWTLVCGTGLSYGGFARFSDLRAK